MPKAIDNLQPLLFDPLELGAVKQGQENKAAPRDALASLFRFATGEGRQTISSKPKTDYHHLLWLTAQLNFFTGVHQGCSHSTAAHLCARYLCVE